MSVSVPAELRLVADMIPYLSELESRCRLSTGEAAKGMIEITPDDARRIQTVCKSLVFLEVHSETIVRSLERDAEYQNKRRGRR